MKAPRAIPSHLHEGRFWDPSPMTRRPWASELPSSGGRGGGGFCQSPSLAKGGFAGGIYV